MKALGKFLKKHGHSLDTYGIKEEEDAKQWADSAKTGDEDSEEAEENRRRKLAK